MSWCWYIAETTFLELRGSRSLSGEERFRINLCHTRWQHQIDVTALRLHLLVRGNGETSKSEQYHFRMNSRQQLASWAAELIQASTFHSGAARSNLVTFNFCAITWHSGCVLFDINLMNGFLSSFFRGRCLSLPRLPLQSVSRVPLAWSCAEFREHDLNTLNGLLNLINLQVLCIYGTLYSSIVCVDLSQDQMLDDRRCWDDVFRFFGRC